MPLQSNALALLPLMVALVVLALRFYAREGAISIFSASFMLATLSVALLVGYMALNVTGMLPAYSWAGFGGFGLLLAVGGLWSYYR